MKVEKIDHIHVSVKNLDKAISLFTDLLGRKFDPLWEGSDYGIRTAYNRVGFDFIQVMDPNRPSNANFGGEGICCVSLKVPDIEEAIAELESRGIKMISRVKVGQLTEVWFDAANTFGVQIELCEYPGNDIVAASSDLQQGE